MFACANVCVFSTWMCAHTGVCVCVCECSCVCVYMNVFLCVSGHRLMRLMQACLVSATEYHYPRHQPMSLQTLHPLPRRRNASWDQVSLLMTDKWWPIDIHRRPSLIPPAHYCASTPASILHYLSVWDRFSPSSYFGHYSSMAACTSQFFFSY